MEVTTVHNINDYTEDWDVYIGRARKGYDGYFGNEFKIGEDGDRETVVRLFRLYFYHRLTIDPEYKRRIEELRGKRLGCFCAPEACHGDVIASYLNGQARTTT